MVVGGIWGWSRQFKPNFKITVFEPLPWIQHARCIFKRKGIPLKATWNRIPRKSNAGPVTKSTVNCHPTDAVAYGPVPDFASIKTHSICNNFTSPVSHFQCSRIYNIPYNIGPVPYNGIRIRKTGIGPAEIDGIIALLVPFRGTLPFGCIHHGGISTVEFIMENQGIFRKQGR